jgi:hypothetical protein
MLAICASVVFLATFVLYWIVISTHPLHATRSNLARVTKRLYPGCHALGSALAAFVIGRQQPSHHEAAK